jgi:hypothetical protein
VGAVEGEPFRSGVRQRWWMRKRIGLVTVGALTMVAALTTATALATNLDGGIAAAASGASHAAVSAAPSLPRPAVVVRGRFVKPVALDGGVLEVVPAPAGDRPLVSLEQAAQEIWASPVLQGRAEGALGYGLVTISLRVAGVPHITKLPAWVGFAKSSGFAGCPEEPVTSTSNPAGLSEKDLPSSGYAAVVIGAAHGSPAVAFTAPSVLCGSVRPATLAPATEVLSVPWQEVTGLENQAIQVRVSLPACGDFEGITSVGSTKVTTVTVAAVVPDVHGRCNGSSDITETVALGPPGNPPDAPPPLVTASTLIRHGPLGPSQLAVAPGS